MYPKFNCNNSPGNIPQNIPVLYTSQIRINQQSFVYAYTGGNVSIPKKREQAVVIMAISWNGWGVGGWSAKPFFYRYCSFHQNIIKCLYKIIYYIYLFYLCSFSRSSNCHLNLIFNFSIAGYIQRCVIIQRDEKGYGLTVRGDNPVYVESVKAG